MSKILQKEQKDIVDYVNARKRNLPQLEGRKRVWNKYVGDLANKVLVNHLNSHLTGNFTAVGPSVFIEGAPTEFDLIIVRKEAKPLFQVNAYPRPSVKAAIEVKERGLFVQKIKADELLLRRLQILGQDLQGIRYLYITFHESETLIRATRRVLGEDAFFLSTGSSKNLEIISGEWERFLQTIQSIVTQESQSIEYEK
jgi:hypothetical protein